MRKTLLTIKPLIWSSLFMILVGCSSNKSTVSEAPVESENESVTTFYIVRHAEKLLDGTSNPPLTKEGVARAEKLSNLLSEELLSAVYSTPYKRTSSTAKPTAIKQNKAVQIYDPSDHKGFLEKALKTYGGGTILVVGHSNTVPVILNGLTKSNKFEMLDDDEYDKLFKVSVSNKGNTEVEVQTF